MMKKLSTKSGFIRSLSTVKVQKFSIFEKKLHLLKNLSGTSKKFQCSWRQRERKKREKESEKKESR